MEHAVQLWNPWLKKDIECLEKVQKRAVKMIQGVQRSDYENKLEELGLTTLEERRTRGDVIQTFKIIRGIDNVEYSTWFKFISEVNTRNSRSVAEAKLAIPLSKLDIRKYFFSVRMTKVWNQIPNAIRQNVNTEQFKIDYDNFKEDVKNGATYLVL